MLHLQEKAHFSLDEFRRGKDSPMLSRNLSTGPKTPDGEDDELSVLGGKTRLVSKREPSSPILMDRSPISQNPIVPLPLSPNVHNQLSASVLEYLKSFGPSNQPQDVMYQPQSASVHGSYDQNDNSPTQYSTDTDISPVSMYGMSSMTSSFQAEPSSYVQQPSIQGIMRSSQNAPSAPPAGSKDGQTHFPQYFPVYDYGMSSSSNYASSSNGVYNNGSDQIPMLDANPMPAHRRSSGSPDGNMQTTWLDFVNTMSMQ